MNKTLTVIEALRLRTEAEEKCHEAIHAFEEATGLSVSQVRIQQNENLDHATEVVGVYLKVEMPMVAFKEDEA